MSDGLSWYIAGVAILNILAMVWLIWWSGKGGAQKHAEGEEMGHTWDGDLKEFNNPLPRWWLWMFYGTIAFAFIYLALFPGLGKYAGALAWTQQKEWKDEMKAADEKYGPIFAQYAKMDLNELMKNEAGLKIGKRLFLNYCSVCHGSDAKGARGFPNLTDSDSLYGRDPETIKRSIMDGREGLMPEFGAALGESGVDEVANYVLSLSGRQHDAAKAAAGKAKFAMCAGCHLPDGTGNTALGAPNLTDKVWLYGGSLGTIKQTIAHGRNGKMPAHRGFLGADKVHLLSAYIASLSNQ